MAEVSSAKRERSQIEWRRNKVQELVVKGYNQYEIADTLKISQPTISRDLDFLKQQAQENLKTHIQNKLPEEYQRCLTGMNLVLKLSWQIANNSNSKQNGQDNNVNSSNTMTTGDERTRLQALALINDCYKYIMDLTTNGIVITDAIKFVQTNKEKLSMSSKKEDDKESKERDDEDREQLKEKQEEETGKSNQVTTNQVF
jgi:predicted transcriptional regulator